MSNSAVNLNPGEPDPHGSLREHGLLGALRLVGHIGGRDAVRNLAALAL